MVQVLLWKKIVFHPYIHKKYSRLQIMPFLSLTITEGGCPSNASILTAQLNNRISRTGSLGFAVPIRTHVELIWVQLYTPNSYGQLSHCKLASQTNGSSKHMKRITTIILTSWLFAIFPSNTAKVARTFALFLIMWSKRRTCNLIWTLNLPWHAGVTK